MKEKKVDEIENEFRARGEKRLGEERRGGGSRDRRGFGSP